MTTKEKLINKTLKTLSRLPDDSVKEVYDFAGYILKKHEESILQKGMEQLIGDSKTFDFLKEEEELYSIKDLKERFK